MTNNHYRFFVAEPIVHARLAQRARHDPSSTLRRMTLAHAILLALAAATVLGAVAGAQGFVF